MIVKKGKEWVVTTANGGKILGKHPTREAAIRQLRAIEVGKHGGRKRAQ